MRLPQDGLVEWLQIDADSYISGDYHHPSTPFSWFLNLGNDPDSLQVRRVHVVQHSLSV